MIVYKNKRFMQIGLYPDTDWVGDADYVVPDDSELAEKIKTLYPNFEFVFDDDGNPVDVTETEPEPASPPPPTDHERLEILESMFSEIGALSLLSGIKMSNFYVLQVKLGRISIDDIPLRWREAVRKELNI